MSDAIIEVRGLRKSFGARLLFDELALSVERAETLTIVGASGSGKSVLLKTLIGLCEPDAGQILIDGQDIVPLSDDERAPMRQRVSMLFQGGALFDSLSVGENVAYPIRRQRRGGNGELAARVGDALELVGLPGIEAMMPAELSGGMKKRVALARAIAAEPAVVLYDEPTTGLDPINARRINDLIRSIQTRLRMTSVVVTHDLASAYMVSDRIAMLADRRILAVDRTDEFRHSSVPAIHAFVTAMAEPVRGAP
jgi:phospholipid/cholesterol/gamma-HCH transport system ATP-binding protein